MDFKDFFYSLGLAKANEVVSRKRVVTDDAKEAVNDWATKAEDVRRPAYINGKLQPGFKVLRSGWDRSKRYFWVDFYVGAEKVACQRFSNVTGEAR